MKKVTIIVLMVLLAQLCFGIDHLIIAPTEFINVANVYANFYNAEFGIERAVVDQQDIFDQFSGGEPEPEAIKEYIQAFFPDENNWLNNSVLLMGSGTDDWSLNIEKNKIITDNGMDDNFVTFDNETYPSIPIGRIPAQNIEQLDLILNRIANDATNPNLGLWRNKVLLVADDEMKDGGIEGIDGGSTNTMNHTSFAEQTTDVLTPGTLIEKVYGIEYDMDDNGNKPEAKQALIDAVNEGVRFWHFIGHGNEDVLGDEDYFRASDDLELLTNNEYLTLFTAASTSIGRFDNPVFDCMIEQMLCHEDGGIIASVSASRACFGTSNNILLTHFYSNIFNERMNLGDALLDAKLNSGASIYNSKKFLLFGDPLMYVLPPEADNSVMIEDEPDIFFTNSEVAFTVDESTNIGNGYADVLAMESEYELTYSNTIGMNTYTVDYTKRGLPYAEDYVDVFTGQFAYDFTIPADINLGDSGKIVCYIEDGENDFVSYYYPMELAIPSSGGEGDVPGAETRLLGNHPNPFNPSTTISFSISTEQKENSEIQIFNTKGQKVEVLTINSAMDDSVIWNADRFSSGVYFYKLMADGKEVASKKMLLLK
jgi:hypothetical protein